MTRSALTLVLLRAFTEPATGGPRVHAFMHPAAHPRRNQSHAEGRYAPLPVFKGWVKPGVIPPGVAVSGCPDPDESLDALSGHFRIFQMKDGNKYTTDDLLLAWYASSWCPSAASVLDLGSGVGSVAMVIAWRLNGARIVTVEAQSLSVALARKSVLHNGLAKRFDIRHGDLRDPEILKDELYDLITGNPPYFPQEQMMSDAVASHAQKQACVWGVCVCMCICVTPCVLHVRTCTWCVCVCVCVLVRLCVLVSSQIRTYTCAYVYLHLLRIPITQACRYELRGDVCDYCHAAARHLAPGGVFALVFPISPPFQMQRVWTGAQEAGLKMIRHRPVVFKEGEAPILGLFLMCLKEHVPDDFREWTEPPLIIRKRTGSSPQVCRSRRRRLGGAGTSLPP